MRLSLALIALAVGFPAVAAEVSPITVRVEQISGNRSDRFRHTQTKALKIHLSNASTADAMGLRVKHFYFGKAAKEGESEVLESGEKKANVPSHATVTVEAPEFETVYTDEHGKRVSGKATLTPGRRQRNARYKNVEAKGTKLTGYGVRVYSGNNLVAESFSEPGLKDLAP